MKRTLLSPMPWAVLVLGVAFFVSNFDRGESPDEFRTWSWDTSSNGKAEYPLIRPFVSREGAYSIALEGGRQPIFAFEVPSVTLGPASDRPLQLLLLGDWESQSSRVFFERMGNAYRADTDGELPPLKLSLLPSRTGGRTGGRNGHLFEWIIAVHFVSNQATTMPTFLGEISTGVIGSEADKLRKRLEEIEPGIVSRIVVFLQSGREIFENVYRIAQAQLRLNERALRCAETTQLVAMKQILTGNPNEDHIHAFLLRARIHQDYFLASPAGLIPLEPKTSR